MSPHCSVLDLLDLLRCPQSQQHLQIGGEVVVTQLNARIARKEVKAQSGRALTTPVDGLLVTSDGRRAYQVRSGIPVLLYPESVALEPLG